MQFSAAQIAMMLSGKVEGDATTLVASFGKIEEATAGQLSFLANPKYEDYLYSTSASVILINESQELKKPVAATLIRVPDAYSAFAVLLQKYEQLKTQELSGIQQPVYIDATAKIGENVFIGAFTYIGEKAVIGNAVKIFPSVFIGNNAIIGEGCILHPGVKIYHNCILGKNVVVHAGVVIGSDGFGFAPMPDGTFKKIPQIGNVIIEDDVEIGANTAIDRATMGSTIIRSGAKLDNLLQVAHNVEIGSNCVIAAQSGISGSAKIGKNAMIGGQTCIAGHITIADSVKVGAQSGVTKSIKIKGAVVNGTPAHDYTASLRSQAVLKRLPELEKRIDELEKLINELLAEKIK